MSMNTRLNRLCFQYCYGETRKEAEDEVRDIKRMLQDELNGVGYPPTLWAADCQDYRIVGVVGVADSKAEQHAAFFAESVRMGYSCRWAAKAIVYKI